MGVILVVGFLVILLLILWLPTLLTLLSRDSAIRKIVWFLFFEVLIAVGLLAILDLLGANNPAGYLFVVTVLVSVGGFVFAKLQSLRRKEKR